MQANVINPFLSASVHVLESVIQVKPILGELKLQTIQGGADFIWLRIGIVGQVTGDIIFGFPQLVALRIASGMMGGYVLTQFDELSRSAISELGNMISGNATTMLYNQGIKIDITPPSFLQSEIPLESGQAITIPLHLEQIGEFNICVLVDRITPSS